MLAFIGSQCDIKENAMFKHLLVPTDGSPLSAKAVQAAIEFAKVAKASDRSSAVSTKNRASPP